MGSRPEPVVDSAKTIQDQPQGPTSEQRVPALDPTTSISNLMVGDIIGEGGMGIVRVATQLSLARTVAIKIARPGATERDARRMLREAWVTGFLEHPGVIPIYDIVKGDDGTAVVVMRRVDGVTWEERLVDEQWARKQGARDLFEQNLHIFVRICEILEFAHAKGVLHRDVKPGNVMLGAYGEVYLLDWGLAVGLSGAAADHLPNPDQTRDIAGTFAYAAPEMVGIEAVDVGVATDVYLLGAVLYELTAGHPPHDFPTMPKMLESIARTPPAMPDDASPRYAAICRRAMARDPKARYASVAELRRAVVELLNSRGYEQLLTEAESTLGRLAEACARKMARRHVYDLYGECRFAFREALRAWPENHDEGAEAARGLAAASALVIEHELEKEPDVAAALLEEATSVAPELAARVRVAVTARAKARDEARKIAIEHDTKEGWRARVALFVGLGVTWSVTQLLADHLGPVTHARFGIGATIQLGILAVACLTVRDLTSTTFNRRMVGVLAITMMAMMGLFFAGARMSIDLAALRTLQIGAWAVLAACLTVLLERRFWPMTAGLVGAFAVTIAFPEARAIASAIGTLGVTANLAVVWGKPRT